MRREMHQTSRHAQKLVQVAKPEFATTEQALEYAVGRGDTMPEELEVREVRVRVAVKGF